MMCSYFKNVLISPVRIFKAVISAPTVALAYGSNGEEVPQRKATVQVPNSYLQYLELKHMKVCAVYTAFLSLL